MNRLFPILLLLLQACTGHSGQGSNRQGGLETGKVIPDVKCTATPSYSYAVYLPSSYREGEPMQVVLAFDPRARGTYPVDRYKELAEKYGFILMGSNDSRNGLPTDRLGLVAEALFKEIAVRFHADSTRILLTGFSGGARVACIIGMFGDKVKGVIGCGAGIPETEQQHLYTFDYFVIAGEADPNLSEVIIQDQALTQADWKHQLMVIPGGHEWPPVPEMDKAIRWMRGELPPLPQPNLPLATYYGIDREAEQRNTIMTHFISGDTAWMKKEIGRLNAQTAHSKTRNDSLTAKRLMGFLGLMCWSNSTAQLNQGLLDQALRSLTIYRMTEPENPAVDSLFTIYYQKRNH